MSAVVPFSQVDEALRFIRGGNATFTLESLATGNHFTYKVTRGKDDDGQRTGPLFAKLLGGPDNEADYRYLGILDENKVRLTRQSRFSCEAPSVKALNFAISNLAGGRMPPQCLIRHEGRCGVCNRKLTHPESLDRGIGPECWEKRSL